MSVLSVLAVSVLFGSASALSTPPPASALTPTTRVTATKQVLGSRVAAAAGTAVTLLPLRALAAEDGGWSLPALPALPGLPAWLQSTEVHDLGVYFAQTVISWGVPTAAVGALIFMLRPTPNGMNGEPKGLPPALAKALGMDNGPKEYLEIERLNEKLGSFEYSFRKASTSPASALRVKTKADIERQLGAEFRSFGLDGLTVEKVFNAASGYRQKEEQLAKRLEAVVNQLRAITLTPSAPPPAATAGSEPVTGKVVPTEGATSTAPAVAAAATTAAAAGAAAPTERSVVDKIMWGQNGRPEPKAAAATAAAPDAAAAAVPMPMPFGLGGGASPLLKPLLKQKAVREPPGAPTRLAPCVSGAHDG